MLHEALPTHSQQVAVLVVCCAAAVRELPTDEEVQDLEQSELVELVLRWRGITDQLLVIVQTTADEHRPLWAAVGKMLAYGAAVVDSSQALAKAQVEVQQLVQRYTA